VARGSSRFLKFLLTAAVLTAILVLAHNLWLPAVAAPLIHDDGPAKADVAVVLAGDRWGLRVLKGAEMVQKGFVPVVLVSGPCGDYGLCESQLAIDYAVGKGCPREWFIAVPHWGMSTREEADVMLREMRKRNVGRFLLVTSDYHTARSRRIYASAERTMGYQPEMRAVAVPDYFFRRDSWWRDREGQKIVVLEWAKTVATMLGK
jgi:uncharacterized SAM-binding protein YcdF (DUF218 family)